MKCVILAGGGGLRLWPLSRKSRPKQFLPLIGETTLFSKTVSRNIPFCDSILTITNDDYRFIAEQELEKLHFASHTLLLESVGRNTAPAIALACLQCEENELIFVVPADAAIAEDSLYAEAVLQGQALAKQGKLVTFGIRPTSPHTEYGYIQYQGNDVLAFKEKPSSDTAQRYLQSGDYLWNSGMFMFYSGIFLRELEKYRPDIYHACRTVSEQLGKESVIRIPEEEMLKIPAESIDYAVMERSDCISVVPSSFSWSDVGGLEALSAMLPEDECNNRKKGENIIISACKNVDVISEAAGKLIVVNDLENVLITSTNDATYITKHGSSQQIKAIIQENNEEYASFFNENTLSYRPWGHYEVLLSLPTYKVKRILVKPSKRLSLQKHEHRSEHWIVVSGLASITIGNKEKTLAPGQSVYIPEKTLHRVANYQSEPLIIIEIALGSIISEDDIIRFEDDFQRETRNTSL